MFKKEFIGRKRELTELNVRYNGDKKEVGVIYGRCRIGKSALIKEFLANKNGVLFQANNPQFTFPRRLWNTLTRTKNLNDTNTAFDLKAVLYTYPNLFLIKYSKSIDRSRKTQYNYITKKSRNILFLARGVYAN